MAVFDDGRGAALAVGGEDWHGVGSIAQWNGAEWEAMGTGIDGRVLSLATFDDGSGPALYAGGSFAAAGGMPASHIARWDGKAWSSLGSGLSGVGWPVAVRALAVYDDGSGPALYAAGLFSFAGGAPADHIAKWDGESWSALGSGMTAGFGLGVAALAVYDDGTGPALFVGGYFWGSDGTAESGIVRWDGHQWSSVGGGVSGGMGVSAMCVHDDGTGPALYVGGDFTTAGEIPARRIAKWNGTAWSAVGTGMNQQVNSLATHDDGTGPALYAGGSFTMAGDIAVGRFARWNGSRWEAVGGGIEDGTAYSMSVFDDGTGAKLYAGRSPNNDVRADHIARWDGTEWAGVGRGINGFVGGLVAFDDGSGPSLFMASAATSAGGVPIGYAAKWNGTGWSRLSSGLNNQAGALAVFDDGSGAALYVGGSFTVAGGTPASRIAKWDGTAWSALGSGIRTLNGNPNYQSVLAMAVYDDGAGPALYVGGDFDTAGDVPASGVARWNGETWSALGTGVNGGVHAMAVYDDGTGPALYVGGFMGTAGGVQARYVAKWDGNSWSSLGSGIASTQSNPWVRVLAVHDDGNGPALYAGGSFTLAGGVPARNLAKWNGSAWSPVGSGLGGEVESLLSYNDGSGPALFAGGWFESAGGNPASKVARWNGVAWSGLGGSFDATVGELAAYDDGSGVALYVSGQFWTSPAGDSFLAKWGCAGQ
jgi:hypothetical protein